MNINITIANKRCTVQGTPVIVCGNSDYIITFAFDAEWDQAAEKTARFSYVRDGTRRYKDIKLTDDTVAVPAMYKTMELQVGVYAGDLVTSTPARIPCEKSIVCDTCLPGDLYPDQYEQLHSEMLAIRDAAASVEDLEALREATASAIVCEASGEVIAVSDASDRQLQGFTLYGKTTQAQDRLPTPEAPIPLVSVGNGGSVSVTGCGKNLLDIENLGYVAGIGHNVEQNIFGTLGRYDVGTHYMPCLPNTTYTFSKSLGIYLTLLSSVDIPAVYVPVTTYAAGHDGVNKATIITGANDRYICFYIMKGSEVGTLTHEQILATSQLEIGATATLYEPYIQPQTLTVQTPNGIHGLYHPEEKDFIIARDEIDGNRNVYVHRVLKITVTAVDSVEPAVADGIVYYASTPIEGAAKYQSYPLSNRYSGYGLTHHGTFEIYNGRLYIADRRFTDVATANAILAEEKPEFIYTLETPIERPLTEEEKVYYAALHTNKPNTTIFNDSGAGMKVEYVADSKAYIDNKFAQLAAQIVNNT